ncbi:MAG: hypothetical protein ACRD4D_00345 [Candidatus Acidiferrales bacterium]
MKVQRRFVFAGFSILLFVSAAAAEERFQERLPANTLAYVSSSGLASLESVRGTNPLLRLLAAPEMEANWEALKASQARPKDPKAKPADPQQDKDILELLKAPGLVAMLPPDNDAPAVAAGPAQAIFLFLLDTTGQEERIEKLRAHALGTGSTYESYEFEGVTVEEARSRAGVATGYLARVDRWLVGGSEKAAAENWIRAVRQAPELSLKNTEAYGNTRAMLGGSGQWEAYLNLPALVDFFAALPSLGPSAPPPEQLVAALGLRAFGPLLATAEFRADTTRYELVLARREAAANPLDALAPAAPQFASLPLGGNDALGYSVTRVDLQAGWSYLHGAAATLFPPAALFVQMADSFLHEQTGFTLPQVISVWGDELAHFEYAGKDAMPLDTVWALRHHDRTRVLALVEGALPALGQRLGLQELERVAVREGVPAYYKLAFKSDASPVEAQPEATPAYFLAVTDEWLLFALSEPALQRTLARGADGPSLADSEVYRRARSRFPAELSTFGFMDVDAWLASGVVERFLEQAAAAQKAKPAGDETEGEAPAEPPPAPPKLTLPRGYLKWIVTGTTQDARGVYHSGYIE